MVLEEQWKALLKSVRDSAAHARKIVPRGKATFWHFVYVLQYRISIWKVRHTTLALGGLLLALVAVSVYLLPILQVTLEAHYSTEKGIEGLRSLILNLGSPLIGAAAIVASLVMFAMQINIERMPHGLFRRLSADPKLLSAFGAAFLLAIGVAVLSVITEKPRLAVVVLAAVWGIVFILYLFLYAFRRALLLVNPLQQLSIVIEDARTELRIWAKRAQRATPLLEPDETPKADSSPFDSTHDVARTAYFRLNAHWTQGAKRAIQHSMSFARRYAEQGDYEISAAALNVVVGINAAYVEAKGKMELTRFRGHFIL